MRNDPTVDEEGVVQSGENAVVTAPASEGRELLGGYSGVVVPHGTTIGGERRQLPAPVVAGEVRKGLHPGHKPPVIRQGDSQR
jgi:hypothetical protein